MGPIKLLLFDLDDTLLRRDKTVSERNLRALGRCQKIGAAVGVATSRSEQNADHILRSLRPEVLITSGGASVKVYGKPVFTGAFTPEETLKIVASARKLCGPGVRLDADTDRCCYHNYAPGHSGYVAWGEARQTDFSDFREEALMVCADIPDPQRAAELRRALDFCDMVKFTDGNWYKLTRAGVTKEAGLSRVCEALGIAPEDIAAFGDDVSDLGMLRLAGLGVAMANAVPEVKAAADVVIGDNDSDAIAEFLENTFSLKEE